MSDHLPVILFLLPFVTAISMPLVGLRRPQWCRPLALAAALAMCVVSAINLYEVLGTDANAEISGYAFGGWPISSDFPSPPLGIEWGNDRLASLVAVALSLVGTLCLIFGGFVPPRSLGRRLPLYYTLILILISGLTGLVFARDLFNVFVFLEVAALAAYALVAIPGGGALVAAFRYLILGTLGASFYLLGVVFLYAATGTLNMPDMFQQLTTVPELLTSKAVIAGTTFIFIGLGIKMALFPMHGWLPGAYTRAPDAVTPLLAALMTKMALYTMVRIMFWVLGAGADLGQVHVLALLGILGAVAAVLGALLALSQQDVKRMFAYGGISHVGLILVGISQENATGFAGGMFYLINDAVMQAGLFFIAGAACYHCNARRVEDMTVLRSGSPWILGVLIVLALSMIGIPPTGGFFGKWHIILGAIEAGNYLAVAAVIIATLLTMGYFQRLFVCIFAERPSTPAEPSIETRVSLQLSLGLTSAAVILLGIFSDPMIKFFRETAKSAGL